MKTCDKTVILLLFKKIEQKIIFLFFTHPYYLLIK